MPSIQTILVALVAALGLANASPIATNTTAPIHISTALSVRDKPSLVTIDAKATNIDCFGRWHAGYVSFFYVEILNIPDADIPDLCGGLWDNLKERASCDPGRVHFCGHRHNRNTGLKWVFESEGNCPPEEVRWAFHWATGKKYGRLKCRPNWDFRWESEHNNAEDLLSPPPNGPPFEVNTP